MEYAIIALILFAAAWLVVRRALRALLSRESGCGRCGSCPNAGTGPKTGRPAPGLPTENGCRCDR